MAHVADLRRAVVCGDLTNSLVVSGPTTRGVPVQRFSGHLSGSSPYTTRWDVIPSKLDGRRPVCRAQCATSRHDQTRPIRRCKIGRGKSECLRRALLH
jgi:hypothetical protein